MAFRKEIIERSNAHEKQDCALPVHPLSPPPAVEGRV